MRRYLSLVIGILTVAVANASFAQDMRWIQIEAQPSLLEAETRARIYSQEFPDIQAHSIGSGWYALTLGPLPEDQADLRMSQLRDRAAIPRDSFLATGSNYRQRIYPIGPAPIAIEPSQPVQSEASEVSLQTTEVQTETVEISTPPDETLAQARASENLLSRDQKMDLQRFLKWAGYYNSTIDASFGRGTRASMAAWQADNGHEETGVLTTAQRAELRAQYFAIFDGLGLRTHRDLEAGISIDLPTEVVEFDTYAAPLAHFTAKSKDTSAHVFLISARGNRGDLAAIFGILPTLSIVPMNVDKSLSRDRFTITGENSATHAYISATHADGEIKGFGLIWPAEQGEQFDRLVQHMSKSFTTFAGTLDPSLSAEINDPEAQFGVSVRKPAVIKSAVFVSKDGHAVTDTGDLEQCSALTFGGSYDAEIITQSETGIALVAPKSNLAPISFATLGGQMRKGDTAFLSSFPYGGRLGLASVTEAMVAETTDLNGNTTKFQLDLIAEPGDFGGAILDRFGNLAGVLISQKPAGRKIPDNVNFAVNAASLSELLKSAGIALRSGQTNRLDDVALIASAQNMSTPLECWID